MLLGSKINDKMVQSLDLHLGHQQKMQLHSLILKLKLKPAIIKSSFQAKTNISHPIKIVTTFQQTPRSFAGFYVLNTILGGILVHDL